MAIQVDRLTDDALLLSSEEQKRLADQRKVEDIRNNHRGWSKHLRLLWLLLGPGILVMLGDNDAGGVITYAQTGAQYGIGFFVPFLVLMIPVAYVVQEMTVRLGAVTGYGHAELIFTRFGKFWGMFSLVDLVIGNILTLTTEFIGMGAGLAVFGVPLPVAIILSAALLIAIVLSGRYFTAEKAVLAFAIFNVVFVPIAFMVHSHPIDIWHSFGNWSIPGGFTTAFLFLIIANVGTTIAPWMLFYQQGAVVDKGLTPKDIRHGRIDTLTGSVLMGIIAIAIVVTTGSSLFAHHISTSGFSPAQFISALAPFGGKVVSVLFGLGLFEAGFVAAVTVAMSSAWSFGEAFKVRHSMNWKLHEAPAFYSVYVGSVVFAAAIVLIPHAPLELIAITVQVIATLLMPPALGFLLLLLNDKELMGQHVNGIFSNVFSWTIVVGILALSTVLGVTTVLPGLIHV